MTAIATGLRAETRTWGVFPEAWLGELVMTKASYDTSTPGVAEALVAATDKFRRALDGITGIHCFATGDGL